MSSYDSEYESYQNYDIAELALYGVLILPLIILWIITLCTVRRNADPVRVGFSWLKAAYPLWIVNIILHTIAWALYLYRLILVWKVEYYSSKVFLAVYEGGVRCMVIGNLFEIIFDIVLIICFVELSNGFLFCLSGARTTAQNVMRYVAYACGFLLFAVGISWFALNQSAWSIFFNWQNSPYYTSRPAGLDDKFLSEGKLVTAFDILNWLMSLPLIALAAFVVHKVKDNRTLRQSSILLLVSTILNFLRCVWNVAFDASWVLPYNVDTPLWSQVVQPILGTWPVFVLLVLLFVMGNRKRDGLWTTKQPWEGNGVRTAYAPAAYVVPVQGQQQYQQYPQGGYAPQQQYQAYPAQNITVPQYQQPAMQQTNVQYYPGVTPEHQVQDQK